MIWAKKVVVFLVGFFGTALLMLSVLYLLGAMFNTRLVPRGPGWIVIPIIAGVTLAKLVPEKGWGFPALNRLLEPLTQKFLSLSLPARAGVVGSVFWAFVVIAFVIIFEPYGSYVSDRKMWQIVKIVVFPPLVSVAGYFAYTKFIKGTNGKREI